MERLNISVVGKGHSWFGKICPLFKCGSVTIRIIGVGAENEKDAFDKNSASYANPT